jgi:uncharacterized membrane protein
MSWVLFNTNYGVYKNKMQNGTIKSKLTIGTLWTIMLFLEAVIIANMISHYDEWWKVLLIAALTGFTVYYVFNITTLVISDTWGMSTALIDIGWGTTLFAISGTSAWWILNKDTYYIF